ncbi:MAG: hypothetical protein A2469_00025 [Candidatus Magasanikbacteria bacterium RIFOXYC2_FULL_40_16]|uniref:Antitoxin n=2 Tax=Candidatus Magasanikiibacteriota TaxID=1752731 RepID=A0A1F6NFW5_9BACT|nr:MAG: hypothetical protein A2373_04085 [Candidatus Magasanikbacteria bacterium RIFOXYB1_FULL_40_15]OGH89466.1 MAG: hypothetical protein A2469_00025 [Candidatus Magasanikbacteria bacterium RIFOXYC2_FULL_40_16]
MNTKTTISISEARKKIFDIAEEVQRPGNYYTFTENGKPKVVMMSAEEFESLIETMEILSDPKAMKRMEQAEKELKRGDYVSWTDFKKGWGYTQKTDAIALADKGKKKYRVGGGKKKR